MVITERGGLQLVGVGGYINYIRPEIFDWLVNGYIPKLPWQLNCRHKIFMSSNEAEQLIAYYDNFLTTNHELISQDRIDAGYRRYYTRKAVFQNVETTNKTLYAEEKANSTAINKKENLFAHWSILKIKIMENIKKVFKI